MAQKQPNKKGNDSRQKLGRWGESVAATHLEANGFAILHKNWRCRQGEVDLVAQKGESLHFVEVKTRRGRGKGSPEEAITSKKAQKLINTALAYIGEHELDDADWQVDLIAVELDSHGKLIRCEHLPNILY